MVIGFMFMLSALVLLSGLAIIILSGCKASAITASFGKPTGKAGEAKVGQQYEGSQANSYIKSALDRLTKENCTCGERENEISGRTVHKDVKVKYQETIAKLEEIGHRYSVDAENCGLVMYKYEETFRIINDTIKTANEKGVADDVRVYDKILVALEYPHEEITGYDLSKNILSELDGEISTLEGLRKVAEEVKGQW